MKSMLALGTNIVRKINKHITFAVDKTWPNVIPIEAMHSIFSILQIPIKYAKFDACKKDYITRMFHIQRLIPNLKSCMQSNMFYINLYLI